jgi:hypothetical protein
MENIVGETENGDVHPERIPTLLCRDESKGSPKFTSGLLRSFVVRVEK